ncbi:MAG TPA: NUDIX hydrolase [Pyrinomonadaceae bacterium]|nr:NUDIX hydrolase [Pyrinomonadaceae bacterium]
MFKQITAKIWRKLPWYLRAKIIRFTQAKFTVSVAAVITNADGKILLLDHVYRPASGWGIPGGFVDFGEQPEAALRRELREETELELENVRLFRARILKKHVEFIFEANANGEAKILSREILRAEWLDFEEMPVEMSGIQKATIKEVLGK